MNKNVLLAARGSFLIGVDTTVANSWDLIDFIRLKKEVTGQTGTMKYDLNGDGRVDGEDIEIMKKKLLNAE